MREELQRSVSKTRLIFESLVIFQNLTLNVKNGLSTQCIFRLWKWLIHKVINNPRKVTEKGCSIVLLARSLKTERNEGIQLVLLPVALYYDIILFEVKFKAKRLMGNEENGCCYVSHNYKEDTKECTRSILETFLSKICKEQSFHA